MKAMMIKTYGPPETLTLSEVDDPRDLKDGEVLVEVHASSVNPVDCKIRSGNLKFLTGSKFPKILGGDFAGIVLESKSPKYNEGDEVRLSDNLSNSPQNRPFFHEFQNFSEKIRFFHQKTHIIPSFTSIFLNSPHFFS